jgi:hypothetical protein
MVSGTGAMVSVPHEVELLHLEVELLHLEVELLHLEVEVLP